ncbi:unnamed protein product, partial [Didymodactylos carnosus]
MEESSGEDTEKQEGIG